MSIPQIRTEAIEAVGRKILMEYDPSLLSGQPCSVPIETIIETKFDLILEFHTLRKNPKILGETIFDDGAVVLYDQIHSHFLRRPIRFYIPQPEKKISSCWNMKKSTKSTIGQGSRRFVNMIPFTMAA